jgi:nucleoside-diphosphate-sugar epimerase
MKKVLVTGGSGYFGSALVRKLHDRGFDCVIFDINDAEDRLPDVRFIQGDIRDFAAIDKASKKVDIVFHNVAQVPLAKNASLFESVNGLGTENMLHAALSNEVSKVVYTSSSAVFGVPKKNPVTELTLPDPGEDYGLAKYKGEVTCHAYQARGLDVSIVRPRTIIGLGRLGIFQILFEWIRQGANVPVLGDGNNLYQFIHADDLADACILAGLRSGSSTYNCGTDRFGTMRNVLESLCEYAGTGSKVRGLPMAPAILGMKLTSALRLSPLGAYHALMYGGSMYFDISKAKRELNWTPKFSNNEMFIQSYEWYLKNRELVISQGQASHHRSAVKQGILALVKKVL